MAQPIENAALSASQQELITFVCFPMLGTLQLLFKGIVIPMPNVNHHVCLHSSFVFKGMKQGDTFWPPQSFIDLIS